MTLQKQIKKWLKVFGYASLEEAEEENCHSVCTLASLANVDLSEEKLICQAICWYLLANDSLETDKEFLTFEERQTLINLRGKFSLKAKGLD